jgi:hypothetical protein
MKKVFLTGILFLSLLAVAWATNNPQSAEVTLTAAGTVYPWAIPFKTVAMTIQSRTAADFKVSTEVDASLYLTVKSGTSYYETSVENYNGTLYFTSANAGQVVEILYWKSN